MFKIDTALVVLFACIFACMHHPVTATAGKPTCAVLAFDAGEGITVGEARFVTDRFVAFFGQGAWDFSFALGLGSEKEEYTSHTNSGTTPYGEIAFGYSY